MSGGERYGEELGEKEGEELRQVRLVDFPVDTWAKAQEHMDELLREFTLIAGDLALRSDEETSPDPSEHAVPRRLLELITSLNARYGTFGEAQERHLSEALDSGVKTVPLVVYEMPFHAAEASRALAEMLEEADLYCSAGEHLLTLATPPELVEFRQWFLGEVIRQMSGEAATPWRPQSA